MSQKLPANDFKCVEETSYFNEEFIKIYNEDRDVGYFIEPDGLYPKKLHELPHDLPFLPEIMEIGKSEKLETNLHDTQEYVIHVRKLRQALSHGLILKKLHKVIKFNQKAW